MEKKYNGANIGITIIITFVITYIFSATINYKMTSNLYELRAIKNNCAQYNPTTAEFEWIKKPVDLISGGVE